MRNERGPVLWALAAWVGFLLTAGLARIPVQVPSWLEALPQARQLELDPDALRLAAYGLGHLFLFGAALPLWVARRMGLCPFRAAPVSGRGYRAGLAVLAGVALVGLDHGLHMDTLALTGHPIPLAPHLVKNAFLLFPSVLSLCLYAFYLLPEAVRRLLGERAAAPWAALAVAVLCALSMGHVEVGQAGFIRSQNWSLLWVVPAAAGAILCRSPFPVFLALFPAQVLVSTASSAHAYLPWRPLLLAFLPAFWAVCFYLKGHIASPFPPPKSVAGLSR